jgi:LysR family glycine cleavage system transcriptional activator
MPLPPLPSVRVFEAVARRLSVTLAAQELHVTPGAVTQQVRKLEDFLGCALFERRPRGLTLTAQGRAYHAACQQALTLIERATAELATQRRRIILVSCTPGFATQWLIPRLQDFLRDAPDIDVHVSTTHRPVDLAREGIHFAVRHGLGDYPGLQSKALLADGLIPVCSPRLVAPRRSATRADITAERLLHDERRDDWRLWCQAAGMDGVDGEGGIVFVDSNAVIEAALAGRGVALVRRSLVAQELATRRLLAVKGAALRTPLAYHLVYRAPTLADPAAHAFFTWICSASKPDG